LKFDALTLLSAKVDAITQRLGRLNVNFASSNAPFPLCEICSSVDHLTMNCQVGSLFAQDASDQVNYVTISTLDQPMTLFLILIIRVGGIIPISHIGLTLLTCPK